MPTLVVSPRARIFHGHEWVYRSEIKKVTEDVRDGDVVTLRDVKGKLLGSAIYNAQSQIVARRFSRQRQELDEDFFHRRIRQALDYRERVLERPKIGRMVWSESDGLPGLIVDRYEEVAVIQTLTRAMDDRIELIAAVVAESLDGVCAVVERNDAPLRQAEGLETRSRMLIGEEPGKRLVDIEGLSFAFEPLSGHKTGLYLDQRFNYGAVAAYAQGREVLDCFTNQGGFALFCAKAGAAGVTGVDTSADCLETAQANADCNGLKVSWREANVFDLLKSEGRRHAEYGMVILDPPSFTRSKASRKDAHRGYKEINLRAFQLLRPGGMLATFSCSHHVSEADLWEVVKDAAVDARVTPRLVQRLGQPLDHPVLLTVPETEYLHGFLLELLPGR